MAPELVPADVPVLSAYGTASIGGNFSVDEWDHAGQLALFFDPPEVSGEGKIPVTILVQNDDSTLYLAVLVGRLFDQTSIEITFDNDNDRVPIESGDDAILFGRNGDGLTSWDGSWYPCAAPPNGTPWCIADDKTDVAGLPPTGTAFGQLTYAEAGETQVFRFDRPLRSGDARDVDLSPGAAVGIQVVVGLGEQRSDAVCAGDACVGGGNAWAKLVRAAADAPVLPAGPSVTVTELGPPAVNGWYRAPTKVRVTAVAGTSTPPTPTATRTWAAPAQTATLGGSELRISGNAAHQIRADGTTIVHAFARDAAGRQGPWVSLPVRIDTAAPTVTPPRIVFRQGGIVGGTPPSTLVSWYGTDAASGIARYELQESIAGGPYRTIATGGPRLTSVARRLVLGTMYRYRVRATDVAGNASLWIAGMPYRVSLVDSTSARLSLGGTWTTFADAAAVGGSVISTTDSSATARLEFDGSAVALVAPSGAGGGDATIELDASALAGPRSVDLSSPDATARVAYRAEWSGTGHHVIEVRSASGGSGAAIAIDAFLVATAVWPPTPAEAGLFTITHEAERLAAGGDVTHVPWVQPMSGYGRGLWGNNRQLAWPARPGETLVLWVPVTPGRWTVRVYLTRSYRAGTVELECETTRRIDVDLGGESPVPTGAIELGTIASSWSTTVGVDVMLLRESPSDGAIVGAAVVGIDRIELVAAP